MTAPRRRKLTAKRIGELLDCDPSTGTLRWKERPGNPCFNARWAGRHAGTFDRTTGYRRVMIDGRYYYEHVIVWVHSRGYWPPHQRGALHQIVPERLSHQANRARCEAALRGTAIALYGQQFGPHAAHRTRCPQLVSFGFLSCTNFREQPTKTGQVRRIVSSMDHPVTV
jgi:hypothetical protein